MPKSKRRPLVQMFLSGEQLRLFKLEGDRLFVRSPERENRFAPGRMSAADIVFERERPAEAV
jgi:hypothetical protein